MKKSGKDRLKCVVYESTLSTAGAVPLPQWGRLRNEDAAFLESSKRIQAYVGKTISMDKAFPNGEGYETRMRLFPHIVISSESEKSFSFAVRQRM